MSMVVIASNNKNKVKEFKSILNTDKIEFKTLSEIGYDKEIIEDGKTFEENAIIKARQIALDLNVIAISDDSGLVCHGLNGAPGIYSARYAGTNNDKDNNELLIKNLQNVSDRTASYVCAICIYHPNGEYKVVSETVDGIIIDGAASIDESTITGEAIPVYKKINDEVISSTIIESGFIKCTPFNI